MTFGWRRAPEKQKGIIVGCDAAQEWLLPWWWESYSACNAFPVTFVDFGMSQQAQAWCECHGELIALDIDTSFVKPLDAICLTKRKGWEALYGSSLWTARSNWFKKPFACLLSSYDSALWIDLDCEILGKLDDLFTCCTVKSQLALVREAETTHCLRWDPGALYNGGVMAFPHGCEMMATWAEECVLRNAEFWSDDNLLSALISAHRFDVVELPPEYNWKFIWGINMNAVIVHWVGKLGKGFIKSHGGIKQSFQKIMTQDT